MRDKVGIFLMESATDDEVAVQLFGNTDKMGEMFDGLKGAPGGQQTRATMVEIDHTGDEPVVTLRSKSLPEIDDVADRPDGMALGVGPIYLPKESEEDEQIEDEESQ